jgi:hypothetical protein
LGNEALTDVKGGIDIRPLPVSATVCSARLRVNRRAARPSPSIRDVSENDFRKLNHKASKPGILFQHRYHVVRVLVAGMFVVPKP